jgi:tRNA C32,U32 (ribose-2'-O)-methylase TrmJ
MSWFLKRHACGFWSAPSSAQWLVALAATIETLRSLFTSLKVSSARTSRSREATRAVTAVYPLAIRAWIKRNGGLKQKMIILRGRELTALYRRC